MKARQRGAALLLLFVVLVTIAAGLMLRAARNEARPAISLEARQTATLAVARDALLGAARGAYCVDPTAPLDGLLPCPDSAGVEGESVAACAGLSRGWLPWKTLNLPALRDASGTCLWYERQGQTARVIAPGAPGAGQARTALAGRTVCGGSHVVTAYLDANDLSLPLGIDAASLAALCGP